MTDGVKDKMSIGYQTRNIVKILTRMRPSMHDISLWDDGETFVKWQTALEIVQKNRNNLFFGYISPRCNMCGWRVLGVYNCMTLPVSHTHKNIWVAKRGFVPFSTALYHICAISICWEKCMSMLTSWTDVWDAIMENKERSLGLGNTNTSVRDWTKDSVRGCVSEKIRCAILCCFIKRNANTFVCCLYETTLSIYIYIYIEGSLAFVCRKCKQ